jgi:hypothetical protein
MDRSYCAVNCNLLFWIQFKVAFEMQSRERATKVKALLLCSLWEPSMKRAIEVICSEAAAAALTKSECDDIVQNVLPMAEQQDRGVHEGLVFAFKMHGAEWKVVVDLQQSWVKFLRKDELKKGMADALSRN